MLKGEGGGSVLELPHLPNPAQCHDHFHRGTKVSVAVVMGNITYPEPCPDPCPEPHPPTLPR